jgi:hypothetical protein
LRAKRVLDETADLGVIFLTVTLTHQKPKKRTRSAKLSDKSRLVTVDLIEARDLFAADPNGLADP